MAWANRYIRSTRAEPSVPIAAHIQNEGLKEFQAGLRDAQGKLPKALGESHKRVGQFIISKIPPGNPNAVGAGTGSIPRASATKRDVLIRVGGSFRGKIAAEQQVPVNYITWGKTPVMPFESGRPYIVGTIEENMAEIEDMFMDEMLKVAGRPFYSAKHT